MRNVSEKQLKAMITRNGGEKVELQPELERPLDRPKLQRPADPPERRPDP